MIERTRFYRVEIIGRGEICGEFDTLEEAKYYADSIWDDIFTYGHSEWSGDEGDKGRWSGKWIKDGIVISSWQKIRRVD